MLKVMMSEVTINLIMLGSFMKNGVGSNLNSTLVVTIHWNGTVDPHFSRASPLDRRDSLFICEKLILKKVGVATYFIFILKGK